MADTLPRIEAASFKPYKKNTLAGFLDLHLPDIGLTLVGCTLHSKEGSRWVGLPARPYQRDDGATCWTPIVSWSGDDAKRRFQRAALEAVERMEAEASQPTSGGGREAVHGA